MGGCYPFSCCLSFALHFQKSPKVIVRVLEAMRSNYLMFRYIGNFLLELTFSTNLACFVFTCIAGYTIWKGGMEGLAAHDLMLLASSTIWMFVTVVLSFILPALPVELTPAKKD